MVSEHRLNEIWRAGYCPETLAFAQSAEGDSPQGRIAFLSVHEKFCTACHFANIFKGMERAVAEQMGKEAVAAFERGDDIARMPGFQAAFSIRLRKSLQDGDISTEMLKWLRVVAERQPYGWRRAR